MTWTLERHEAAKRCCIEASGGDWISSGSGEDPAFSPAFDLATLDPDELGGDAETIGFFFKEEDANFCAIAHTDLPDALREIERLRWRLHNADMAIESALAECRDEKPNVAINELQDYLWVWRLDDFLDDEESPETWLPILEKSDPEAE